jgi:hypothetical protein
VHRAVVLNGMSAALPNRQPTGISTGGQFAPQATGEVFLELEDHDVGEWSGHAEIEREERGRGTEAVARHCQGDRAGAAVVSPRSCGGP